MKLADILNLTIATIFQLEQLIPQAGMGATKKQVLLNTIEMGLKVGEGFAAVNPIIGMVSALADSIVATLNTAGVFGRGIAPVPAPSTQTAA